MVWFDLFERGKAPLTWGRASLEARNLYHSELEKHWGFLHFCENHWKVDVLTMANYSQWYHTHKERKVTYKAAKHTNGSRVCTPKRFKTTGKEEDDLGYMRSEFTAVSDDFGSLRSETPFDDLQVGDNQPSEPEDEATRERDNILSRPNARPLRDPL
jgi:hypothetical protein